MAGPAGLVSDGQGLSAALQHAGASFFAFLPDSKTHAVASIVKIKIPLMYFLSMVVVFECDENNSQNVTGILKVFSNLFQYRWRACQQGLYLPSNTGI